MLSSVIIVLREALEAALIVSILLAVGRLTGLRSRWCALALFLGLMNSWLIAGFSSQIADSFDGAGQELLSVSLLSIIIICLMGIGIYIVRAMNGVIVTLRDNIHSTPYQNRQLTIYLLLIGAVVCAVSREGSEVWIYLASFLHDSVAAYPAFIGGAIGMGIGASLGVIFYYGFLFVSYQHFLFVGILFLALIAGGLSVQIVQDLMQTGFLDSTMPVWDTSGWVAENSLLGQLLYALIGYEARPTALQLIVYVCVVSPFIVLSVWHRYKKPENNS